MFKILEKLSIKHSWTRLNYKGMFNDCITPRKQASYSADGIKYIYLKGAKKQVKNYDYFPNAI